VYYDCFVHFLVSERTTIVCVVDFLPIAAHENILTTNCTKSYRDLCSGASMRKAFEVGEALQWIAELRQLTQLSTEMLRDHEVSCSVFVRVRSSFSNIIISSIFTSTTVVL